MIDIYCKGDVNHVNTDLYMITLSNEFCMLKLSKGKQNAS